MNNSLRCTVCQHQLQDWNRQFYCCDKNQRYCLICQGKNCVRCGQTAMKQFISPRCNHCLKTSSSGGNDMLYEPNCEKYYCTRCMVTRIPINKQPGTICPLPCGHGMQIEKIRDFLKGNCCCVCGKAYEPSTDYDLLNGQKVCFACFKWQKSKIQQWIMNCVSCGETVKKVEDVGNFNQGFLICKNCLTESQIQENVILKQQEQRKIQQKRYNDNMKNIRLNQALKQQQLRKNQQSKPQTQQDYKVKIIQPNYQTMEPSTQEPPEVFPVKDMKPQPINNTVRSTTPNKNSNQSQNSFKTFSPSPKGAQVKQIQSFTQIQPIANQQHSSSKQVPVSSPNPMANSNQGQKTSTILSKGSNNDSNLKKTILQSFPSQKQQPSDLPRSRMKKHLSMETFIQKMKIKIQKQQCKLIQCNECEYEIPESESFQIQNAQHVLKNYCRLCYTFLTNTQLLGFNVNQQNAKLDLSRNTYRRGVSNEKHKLPTNSLISSPEQLLTMGVQQMKLSANNFDNHQKMSATVKVSDNRNIYREECVRCKKTGMSLIRTSDRGALCFQCYYQKRQVLV